ncbi:ribonuclease H-like domain-containing protein [Tanacetum coccineum]|uniref:Ribonuclease H-like domain-containing protein n=1 Tax=Tanacetum coccineum TaxID=301880 RepID=A0ABQ5BLG7_9ASTR
MKRSHQQMIGLDEYAIRKKIIESKTTKLNTDTSKYKTSETVGKTNEVNIEKPMSVHELVVPKPKINRDKVIIEDWYSDDVSEVNTALELLHMDIFGPVLVEIINKKKVLVIKPQNKTPYELLIGKPPSISFMRQFGCPLTILNTLDRLSKFDGKSDEGYLLGYSTSSNAFRVYNKRTKRLEENMHIDFLEDQPNVARSGPDWMFDLDFLTHTMNYILVSIEISLM